MRCCGDPSDCSRPCETRGPEPKLRVIDELHVWPTQDAAERVWAAIDLARGTDASAIVFFTTAEPT